MPSLCFGRITTHTPPLHIHMNWHETTSCMHRNLCLCPCLCLRAISPHIQRHRATSTLPLDYKRFFVLHTHNGWEGSVCWSCRRGERYIQLLCRWAMEEILFCPLCPCPQPYFHDATLQNYRYESCLFFFFFSLKSMYIWTIIGHILSTDNMKPLSNMYINFRSFMLLCMHMFVWPDFPFLTMMGIYRLLIRLFSWFSDHMKTMSWSFLFVLMIFFESLH